MNTFHDGINCSDAKHWIAAMKDEYSQCWTITLSLSVTYQLVEDALVANGYTKLNGMLTTTSNGSVSPGYSGIFTSCSP